MGDAVLNVRTGWPPFLKASSVPAIAALGRFCGGEVWGISASLSGYIPIEVFDVAFRLFICQKTGRA
jgi:hypothetical protein